MAYVAALISGLSNRLPVEQTRRIAPALARFTRRLVADSLGGSVKPDACGNRPGQQPGFFVSAIAGTFTLLLGRIMHGVVFGS
jgi:hypothetical protein